MISEKAKELGKEPINNTERWNGGLTKREYFAAMAMQGMTMFIPEYKGCFADIAKDCIKLADAILEELSKNE
ncbi:MAG: hypothetical protein LBE36_13460 [Flavobacteriaceae bacterium]|jgi:hypothetical protein|nr:hypothetical protein [Flavobacteriaceae bacterium]